MPLSMGSPVIGRTIELSIDDNHSAVGIVSVASGAETPQHTFLIGARRQLVDSAIIQIVGCT